MHVTWGAKEHLISTKKGDLILALDFHLSEEGTWHTLIRR